ncbi:hypothetical protein CWATWH0003_1528b4, partial [Crocosphaera watsonii WH 0003]
DNRHIVQGLIASKPGIQQQTNRKIQPNLFHEDRYKNCYVSVAFSCSTHIRSIILSL